MFKLKLQKLQKNTLLTMYLQCYSVLARTIGKMFKN